MAKRRTAAAGSTEPKAPKAPVASPTTINVNGEDKTGIVVWLKTRAYINDTQRVEAGVYVLPEVPARFSKLSSKFLEVFESEVPSRKLAVIARWAGFNPDGMEDEEILNRVISQGFNPF